MQHVKKIFLLVLALVVGLMVAGCGGDKKSAEQTPAKKVTIKFGVTPVPHGEIAEIIKPMLAKQNIDLQVVEFNDYVQPNMALNDKSLDANFFQHEPYLTNFCKEHKLKLKNVAGIHIEPMGIYSKKIKDLKDVPNGAVIAIPNDPTNGGRALMLLDKAGVLKLKDAKNVQATVQDIASNPKNVKIQEVEAAQAPRTLDDVTLAVINTNFAMQVNLVPTKDALFIEDKTSPYVNVLAVRDGDEKRPEIQALIKVLQSKEVKDFIASKYKGAIVAAF